jgi:hypothetical protein
MVLDEFPPSVLYVRMEKEKQYEIHRSIALNLIPNPNNYKFVESLDGNKQNCSLSNLRWATGTMLVRYQRTFFDELPEGYEPLVYYTCNRHEFDGLFIKWENGIPNLLSFDTKRQYRSLNKCSGGKYKPYKLILESL